MNRTPEPLSTTVPRDLMASVVVFLVALPLCLGIAIASDAPPFAGLIAGIVGAIMVGLLSGSHTSVSGPAAGLTAVVAMQIASLGSFQAFLMALVIAGLLQIALGVARAGFIAAFFPSSVIKGLLAAIGLILILKQLPYLVGYVASPQVETSLRQTDGHDPFTGILAFAGGIHQGTLVIGLVSLALLVLWDRVKLLKRSPIPGPLVVVLLGVGLNILFLRLGNAWAITPSQLVQVPVAESLSEFLGFLQRPDFSQWLNPAIYTAALTLAAVASLETLLNLEAVDRLDPQQRTSPPSRELLAQGVGNVTAGLLGGLPVTSVIVRGSVNINAGSRTRLSTIMHGFLLLGCVAFLPTWLNLIPLSCLAAILLVTGFKLASPSLVRRMWNEGRTQFLPFAITVGAIVLTDLLIGVLIGLGVSLAFILASNVRRPLRRIVEKHLGGDVVHIELANQVSFLNRAALAQALDEVPSGGHVLLDAQNTDYFDPDVLHLIRDYAETTGPARDVKVSLLGFRDKYEISDQIQYVDWSSRELQDSLSPDEVLQILTEGHQRFRSGQRLTRDLGRVVSRTARSQHPLAVVLSCSDSRTPAELIFDLTVGDIFSVRTAGNVTSRKVLGSLEYACAVAGTRLIVVMGHTHCGVVAEALDRAAALPLGNGNGHGNDHANDHGNGRHICQHLGHVVDDIQKCIDPRKALSYSHRPESEQEAQVDAVARANVYRIVRSMRRESQTIDQLVQDGRLAIVGAMYDVATGNLEFLPDTDVNLHLSAEHHRSGPARARVLTPS